MYQYEAEITRVVDGDTVHARVDLGCDVRIDLVLRLYGINAPELHDHPAGQASRDWLVNRLAASGNRVVVNTFKDKREKYGRYLAELVLPGAQDSLNAEMVELGLAKPYFGGAR